MAIRKKKKEVPNRFKGRRPPESKPCPVCGLSMFVEKHEFGGFHKRSKTYWACMDKLCGHRELNEGSRDKEVRLGIHDESIGYLTLTDTEND
jgi:hypothetical protein